MEIKAIETVYKGYRFRSRLEARWAVFFDHHGWEWDYEVEGFQFGSKRYLPDFWLPRVEMWAEVKARELTKDEYSKCDQLARHTMHPCLLLVGPPDFRGYIGLVPYDDILDGGRVVCVQSEFVLSAYHGYYWDENRFYAQPGETVDENWFGWEPSDREAIFAARGARFEHGVSPRSGSRSEPVGICQPPNYQVGQIVRHPTFGEGTVLGSTAISYADGRFEEEVTVRFKGPRGGQKRRLLASLARLQRI